MVCHCIVSPVVLRPLLYLHTYFFLNPRPGNGREEEIERDWMTDKHKYIRKETEEIRRRKGLKERRSVERTLPDSSFTFLSPFSICPPYIVIDWSTDWLTLEITSKKQRHPCDNQTRHWYNLSVQSSQGSYLGDNLLDLYLHTYIHTVLYSLSLCLSPPASIRSSLYITHPVTQSVSSPSLDTSYTRSDQIESNQTVLVLVLVLLSFRQYHSILELFQGSSTAQSTSTIPNDHGLHALPKHLPPLRPSEQQQQQPPSATCTSPRAPRRAPASIQDSRPISHNPLQKLRQGTSPCPTPGIPGSPRRRQGFPRQGETCSRYFPGRKDQALVEWKDRRDRFAWVWPWRFHPRLSEPSRVKDWGCCFYTSSSSSYNGYITSSIHFLRWWSFVFYIRIERT